MGFRVDNVKVTITVNVEFEGSRDITFEYAPSKKFDFDLDPLVKQLLNKCHELNEEKVQAEIAKGNLPDPTILF